MAKIKVAFCVPNMIIGGLETVLINTLTAMRGNPDVDIVVLMHAKLREPLYIKWFNAHPDIPVYIYYPMCNRFEDMRKYCRFFPLKQLRKAIFSIYKKYRRAVMKTRPEMRDIDVFIDYKNMNFFKELKSIKRRKIVWVHGSIDYFCQHNLIKKLPEYDRVVVLTHEFEDEFKQIYPACAKKVTQIYNPIDVAEIRRRADDAPTTGGRYFCHVSRLSEGKDIKTLMDAFELFKATPAGRDVRLVIVGDGDMSDEFKRYATELKSGADIVFTGAVENPYGYMRGAIANILSSESEGLGMVLLESQALGSATISSQCKNGPCEILENGRSGFLFPVGDSNALARHMEYVVTNPAQTREKIQAANEGLDRFQPNNIIKQILNIIRNK